MRSMMTFTYDAKPILTIHNEIVNKGRQGSIDLQPSYQRGYVWNNDFKNKLIYSVIRQFPIGNIIVRTNNGIKEVVDGQQRLTTIYNFLNDDFVVSGRYATKIIEFIEGYMKNQSDDPKLDVLLKKLKNKIGARVKFSNLPQHIKNNILAYNISMTNMFNTDDEEVKEYFMFVQNQDRLRAGEVINSFPKTNLEDYLNQINNLDLFLGKIGFRSNSRKDFDKHFYSIIGFLSDQISYGITDKYVINFALKARKPLPNEKLIENMIKGINTIVNDDKIPFNAISFANIRSTKFLLLLLAFNFIDISSHANMKLYNISILNEKFSAFNSVKTGEIQKAFKGYNHDVIEDFREISWVSKGSHTFKNVKENMDKLGYYVDHFDNEHTKPYVANNSKKEDYS